MITWQAKSSNSLLHTTSIFIVMEPGIREGIHLKAMKTASQHRVLWELVRELAKPIPVYQQSWLIGEVPAA